MATARPSLRVLVNVLIDALLAAAAVPIARWLAGFPVELDARLTYAALAGAAALIVVGQPVGLFRQYWRFAGVSDLLGVAGASAGAAALYAVARWAFGFAYDVPFQPMVAHAVILLVLLGLPRAGYRWLRSIRRITDGDDGMTVPRVLLVGSADDADLFLRALARDRRRLMRVEGLLSPGSRQVGRRLQGYSFLGAVDNAEGVIDRMVRDGRPPAMLVLVSPGMDGAALSRLLDVADRFGMSVRQAPRPTALGPLPDADAAGRRIELKPVAIEDLLNRPQVPLDREGMARLVQGRRVIVTGAGGTIGSELARQVAALGPNTLILLDNGEYALWQIDLELAETHPAVPRLAVIADIRDERRIRDVFEAHQPELVFHAAALKHVPMVEANPVEGLMTNAAGTRHVAEAARAAGAIAMVLISTDKAVNPSSVMGASKRLAEMYCQALDIAARRTGAGMRCVTVRFGNVLGSTGSVVPLFQRQLEHGGPLTVTHPDMQRYFMTVREAVGLVLEASVLAVAGEALPGADEGGIFVLDMGPPVKIVDLARQMIRLAGLRPDADVPIRFTGLRPGEKLFEELFHGAEPPVPTGHPGLLMAAPRTADPAIVGRAIEEVAAACRAGHTRAAIGLLGRLVPEFAHNATGDSDSARAWPPRA